MTEGSLSGACMRQCSLWLPDVCFVSLFVSLLKFTLSMQTNKCEYKFLQQRAEYILHVISKVNSHILLTLEHFFLHSHRFLFDINFKFKHCSACLLQKIKICNCMGFFISKESSGKEAYSLKLMRQMNLQIANTFIKNKDGFFFL